MLKKIAVLSFLVAGLCFTSTVGVSAQDQGYHSPAYTMQYTRTAYPDGNNYFYLPPSFETEMFEVTNGKFFKIQYTDFMGEVQAKFDVHFYTPNGVEFGKVRVDETNTTVSVPHKANTLLPETIKVKVVNRSKTNKDFKFVMFVPTNAVKGVPTQGTPVIYDGVER